MTADTVENTQPRFKTKYETEVVPALMAKFGYKNKMQVPKIEKISVNIGIGEYVQAPKSLEFVVKKKEKNKEKT